MARTPGAWLTGSGISRLPDVLAFFWRRRNASKRTSESLRSIGDSVGEGLTCHPAAGDECQAEHARDNGTPHGLKPITLGSERKLSALDIYLTAG